MIEKEVICRRTQSKALQVSAPPCGGLPIFPPSYSASLSYGILDRRESSSSHSFSRALPKRPSRDADYRRRSGGAGYSRLSIAGTILTCLGHIDLLCETAGKQIGALSSEWGRAIKVLDAQFGPLQKR